jgi:galactokinase
VPAEKPVTGAQVTGPDSRDRAAGLFAQQHGGPPGGTWLAPGRVNLIGEHTDYNDGFVLPFAIGAGVTAVAARRSDGLLALASAQAPGEQIEVALDRLAPGSVTGWAAYPAGMAWALRAAGYPVGGTSLAFDAELPPGAGLASSAALACAAGLALTDLHGIVLPRPQLAAIAHRAENDFVGAPTGIMDQCAVLLGQAGHALLLDCRSGIGTAVPLDPGPSGLALLIVDTGVRHEHAGGAYAARRQACEDAAQALGVRSLRDITDSSELAGLDPLLARRARHVVTENSRVLATAGLLRSGQLGRAGPLLTASHASLRDDFEVSWPEADAAVETAIEVGAYGARMTGGGFGGAVLALVRSEQAGQVKAAITERFAQARWPAPQFGSAVPSAGASRVR